MAVTIEASGLLIPTDAATRLLPVVTEMIRRYLGDAYDDAPSAICNEAAIRAAGWLHERPASGLNESSVGDVRLRYSGTMSPLRASGAMALLSPYKVRGAGVI